MNPFTSKNESCPKCDTKLNKKRYCGSCLDVKIKSNDTTPGRMFPEHIHVTCGNCGYRLKIMECADSPKEEK